MPAGHVITGVGLVTIELAVETLLSVFGSDVEGLKIVAVFPTIVPLGTEHATFATMVIIALDPAGNEANVMVWLAPEPPHTPPPVELQDTMLMFIENTSVTVTFVAADGPALLTRMVFVICDPAFMTLGAVAITERSADEPPTPPT